MKARGQAGQRNSIQVIQRIKFVYCFSLDWWMYVLICGYFLSHLENVWTQMGWFLLGMPQRVLWRIGEMFRMFFVIPQALHFWSKSRQAWLEVPRVHVIGGILLWKQVFYRLYFFAVTAIYSFRFHYRSLNDNDADDLLRNCVQRVSHKVIYCYWFSSQTSIVIRLNVSTVWQIHPPRWLYNQQIPDQSDHLWKYFGQDHIFGIFIPKWILAWLQMAASQLPHLERL